MLGKPFMPWQQYVADVALEIDPDSGRLWYSEYRLTVPRQSGKSTFVLAKAAHRCSATGFFGPRQQLVYTAQTRKDARKKFEEDYAGDLEAARRLKAKPHWGNGNEHIRFPNRSRFGIESTTEKAGHGGTLDEAFIDEAFAQVDGRLEQAFGPAMITRTNTQTGVISTAGWLNASPYLEAKVDHGRRLVQSAEPARVAYFEWSAPQEADPFDREVWRRCMPALGFTINEEAIAAELVRFESSPEGLNGFRRAYLNQWVPKNTAGGAFPADRWLACEDPRSGISGAVQLAVSMTPDRQTVSLLAAGLRSDGRIHVETVLHGAADGLFGAAGLPFAAEVAAVSRRQNAEVAVHPSHPVGALIPDLTAAGARLNEITSQQYVAGCGAFYDAVIAGRLRYRPPQPELDAAVGRAQRHRSGETWRWAGEDISALVAASQAVWAATNPSQGGWAVSL